MTNAIPFDDKWLDKQLRNRLTDYGAIGDLSELTSENEHIVCEFMKGYRDGTTIASGVAKSLLAQANSEKATLMRRIDELCKENEQLREYAASAWQLFVENGAVDATKLPEVDAVRNGLSELGIKVDK